MTLLYNKLKANLCVHVYPECSICDEGWRCLSYSKTVMGRTTEDHDNSGRKYPVQSYNGEDISSAMDLIENWPFEDQPQIIKFEEDQDVKDLKNLSPDLLENWSFDENDETKEDSGYEEEFIEPKKDQSSQEQKRKHKSTNYVKRSLLYRYIMNTYN